MIERGYSELYMQLTDASFRVAGERKGLQDLSHFVAMKGTQYEISPCKLLLVGRATNGWGSLPVTSMDSFSKSALEKFLKPGFDWVKEKEGVLSNGGDYYLSRSPFWRTARSVLQGLGGEVDEVRWIESVGWSNLYKVAPKNDKEQERGADGNPNKTMRRMQIAPCQKILQAEIELWKPKHILVIAGKWWWQEFDEDSFATKLPLREINDSYGENRRGNNVFVEFTAKYECADGTLVPLVVACRPEQRPEETYVRQILSVYDCMEE